MVTGALSLYIKANFGAQPQSDGRQELGNTCLSRLRFVSRFHPEHPDVKAINALILARSNQQEEAHRYVTISNTQVLSPVGKWALNRATETLRHGAKVTRLDVDVPEVTF